MNSQDYRNLQEAYVGVYDNDIREKLEFESWVNNLLEEGYDLSDYTWDELYENYTQLDEISDRLANAAIKSRTKRTDRLQSSASSILPRSDSAQNTIDNKVTRSRNKEAKVNDTIASRNKRTGSNIERIDNRRHESYDQQLDEISQKTATRAFATRATNEFETDSDNPRDFTKSGKSKADQTRSRIEKKYGKAAGNSADRAAHTGIFGRKSSSMPKESYDLYDLILSHLIDEGYADTQEAAERIMVNMSEGWRESIIVEGYKEIDSAKHQRMYARYKNLRTAAMKDARETGEASGDNRFKMSKMNPVIDKSAENLRNKR